MSKRNKAWVLNRRTAEYLPQKICIQTYDSLSESVMIYSSAPHSHIGKIQAFSSTSI